MIYLIYSNKARRVLDKVSTQKLKEFFKSTELKDISSKDIGLKGSQSLEKWKSNSKTFKDHTKTICYHLCVQSINQSINQYFIFKNTYCPGARKLVQNTNRGL